ncbi:hypothetical protein GCM10011369_29130 [Neiella marina]|uniref:TonB-dependent receptor n=2 Tax=Neiella marina TaxID=508461 RepID=A0A8J2XQK4_9GAMM|nr:hypothetical protein GCM10011369_29130 [Neiella marina]
MAMKSSAFRLSTVCMAVLTVLSAGVHAQDANGPEQEQTDPNEGVEVIQVTGLKASLKKSINDKRFAETISDSINSEDIGKTTDQNIADALSRVTGVSVRSEGGEGANITVRGANSQQNNISLNGVQLGSTDFSQGVDLSQFSADILSKIEVVKTPSADHEEGSLGANISLSSAKPLDMNYLVRNLTYQARYNDLAEEYDYKLSGGYSHKFLDETFGVLITAYTETNTVRRDEFFANDWRVRHSPLATDQNGDLVEDAYGLSSYNNEYQAHLQDRDRYGVDLVMQWAPTEDTSLDFSFNYSKQELSSTMHGIRTRGSDYANMVEDEATEFNPDIIGDYTDPTADWHTINTKTNTFTKWENRFALGDLVQSIGKFDNINKIASFNIEHQLTDGINVRTGLGYSLAEQVPDNNLYVVLQNWGNVNPTVLTHTSPEDIEPVGYDCTKGGRCVLSSGTGVIDYGENNTWGDPTAIWDNRTTTGFNPDDLDAQHLSYMGRTMNNVEDEQKSAYIDIDWDVEFGPLTQIEFGAKVSNRNKFVDAQTTSYNSVGEGVVVTNPDTGQPAVITPGLKDIDTALFATNEPFPVSDFMGSLGYGRDNITDGWTTFSAEKAFEAVQGDPKIGIIPDKTNTRETELDNFAVYLKTKFDLLDGQLTGDVGVRYVSTDVTANGYSGVNFFYDPANMGRVQDPFKLQQLRDTSNPLCPEISWYGNDWSAESRWSRVDGLGYDTKGTSDFRDDTPLANAGACHDPRTLLGSGENTWWWLWRHSDVSTEKHYVYGERQFDDNGNLVPTEDRSKRSFAVKDTHDYDLFLPSLNLNYVINDDMIARFAVSKTMSRPQIDSLRPGFKVTETIWGGDNRNNTITLTNTKLDPLESNNLDLSYEWYFSDSGMLAMGLFYKDMTNFEESETIVTYMDDLRDIGLDPNAPQYDVNDLVLIAGVDSLEQCMPKRFMLDSDFESDWVHSGDLEQMCAQFKTTRIKNGKGASIKGVELQVMQTFDDLPGWMAGLGLQANYTYQDSEYDQEVSSIDESVMLPSLPVTYTPEHSYNATGFWEMDGHQVRLSYQGTTDQLAKRSWENGSLWEEGRRTLDFSATYQFNEHVAFTLQAVNLTDEGVRQYYTSRFLELNGEVLDEGSPMDDGATKSRTVRDYRTGTNYRLGVRVNFF